MNYFFISSDQQRFGPFQDSVSTIGDCFLIEDMKQLADSLPDKNSKGVYFIHLIEPMKRVEEYVTAIRKHSSAALIVHVMEFSKGLDLKKHQNSPMGGDVYVSMKSTVDMIEAALKPFGVLNGVDDPLKNAPKDLDREFANMNGVSRFAEHPMSKEMDSVFRHLVKKESKKTVPLKPEISGALMSNDNKDDESGLSLVSDFGDLSLSDGDEPPSEPVDEGMDLLLSDDEAPLDASGEPDEPSDGGLDGFETNLDEEISFGDGEESDDNGLSFGDEDLGDEVALENLGDLDLGDASDMPEFGEGDTGLSLSDDIPSSEGVELDADEGALESAPLSFNDAIIDGSDELSEDAKEKLREIDAIMESTSSQILISPLSDNEDDMLMSDQSLDESLVSDDLNLDSLDFSGEPPAAVPTDTSKKKKEEKAEKVVMKPASATVQTEQPRQVQESARPLAAELKEISASYTVEMERAQASIHNLRADREDLLKKIQEMEEEKIMHHRQSLTVRAELDERKIELSIIRKKSNEEINELKDRLKLHDERRMILEEKNRILTQELEKSNHRNKIDVKKVQMRERELEQKLELLKSDSETQIRHRDLKILELKRKIDAMEFDMESITIQEKKSVESRFELEDKLDKAIKTLRNAITVLEDESDRESAVQTLKKNIDV